MGRGYKDQGRLSTRIFRVPSLADFSGHILDLPVYAVVFFKYPLEVFDDRVNYHAALFATIAVGVFAAVARLFESELQGADMVTDGLFTFHFVPPSGFSGQHRAKPPHWSGESQKYNDWLAPILCETS